MARLLTLTALIISRSLRFRSGLWGIRAGCSSGCRTCCRTPSGSRRPEAAARSAWTPWTSRPAPRHRYPRGDEPRALANCLREVPAIVLLFLTAAGGFVSGLLVALLLKSGAKSKP